MHADIVPILPGATSSLHPAHSSESSIQLLCGRRCHPTDSSDVLLWSYNVISTIGVTARLMGDQGRYGVSKPHSSAEV